MSRKKTEDYVQPDVIDEEEAASNAYLDVCEDAVNRARTKAARIEPGQAGYCDFCGNHFERLVVRPSRYEGNVWVCGRCRDENKLG